MCKITTFRCARARLGGGKLLRLSTPIQFLNSIKKILNLTCFSTISTFAPKMPMRLTFSQIQSILDGITFKQRRCLWYSVNIRAFG